MIADHDRPFRLRLQLFRSGIRCVSVACMASVQAFDSDAASADEAISARRPALLQRLRQHLDVAEATGSTKDQTAQGSPAGGISDFLGRVLDQLSLSAWLPAAMLVGSLAVLLQLHADPSRNLAKAITSLTEKPLGLLIVLLFALVLATMITQAFEFDVIRLLEGYWGHNIVADSISRPFVHHQQHRLDRLRDLRDELTLRAFRSTQLIKKDLIPARKQYIVTLIEQNLNGTLGSPDASWRGKRRLREALKFDWRPFASAEIMRRLDSVESQIEEYPRDHRLMPTRLGNVLRAAEDAISTDDGEDLEGFVIRHWDETPENLRKEHDQYRSRLDMYCTLVLVLLALFALAPLFISRGSQYAFATGATSAGYLILSFVSYAAAIASARGYVTVLKTIAEHCEQPNGQAS
jgi:hypothetical protein